MRSPVSKSRSKSQRHQKKEWLGQPGRANTHRSPSTRNKSNSHSGLPGGGVGESRMKSSLPQSSAEVGESNGLKDEGSRFLSRNRNFLSRMRMGSQPRKMG